MKLCPGWAQLAVAFAVLTIRVKAGHAYCSTPFWILPFTRALDVQHLSPPCHLGMVLYPSCRRSRRSQGH